MTNPTPADQLDAIDTDLALRLIAAMHRPDLATLPGRVPAPTDEGPRHE